MWRMSAEAGPEPRRNLLMPDVERWPLDPSRPVIELEKVSIAFRGKKVLDELDLQIVPGR